MIKRFLYRLLRNDMVARARLAGWSWAKINHMLRMCGQCEIKGAEQMDDSGNPDKGVVRIRFYSKQEQAIINATRDKAARIIIDLSNREQNRRNNY